MFTKKKIGGLLVIMTAFLVLSACAAKPTVDPNQKSTEIAATVQAELTQIAMLTPSATATLEPTPTPTQAPPTPTVQTTPATATPTAKPTVPPASSGDNSRFIGDVNYPDGEVVKAGTSFTKTWTFLNNGTTTWTKDYSIIYLEGNLLGAKSATYFKLTKDVAPGETAEISANFVAPATNGRYTSSWKLYSASGYPFGEYCSIDITVGTPSTGTVTATTEATTAPTSATTP